MLDELIASLRAGDLTLDQFAAEAASKFVYRTKLPYPEDQGNEDTIGAVSSVAITVAVRTGALTGVEADAIYAALPASTS